MVQNHVENKQTVDKPFQDLLMSILLNTMFNNLTILTEGDKIYGL